jgi:hypothetical protein
MTEMWVDIKDCVPNVSKMTVGQIIKSSIYESQSTMVIYIIW